ncbi:MAG: Hsp20/alpha crystallin family protein [Deltaproteobacteria bacterium]|nr:Hsp20/alpha crystallin family protein [Deltaproteobacteria bacterium]
MQRFIKIRLLRDLDLLEERFRVDKELWLEPGDCPVTFRPAADLLETKSGLTLRLDAAGISPADLSISISGQELIVKGRRRAFRPEGPARFLRHEIVHGDFERRFRIPIPVDPEQVEARYADGILEVWLPRLAPAARQIRVRDLDHE